jgi:hypothetical protein
VQFSQAYGGTQLTTRQATPPLHLTCVLHCPYRNALQHTRRWSHVAVEPHVHEQLQHPLSQMWSPEQPEVQSRQVALQSVM